MAAALPAARAGRWLAGPSTLTVLTSDLGTMNGHFCKMGGPQESTTYDAVALACGVRRLHDEYNLERGDQGMMTETAASFLRAKGKVKGAS